MESQLEIGIFARSETYAESIHKNGREEAICLCNVGGSMLGNKYCICV